MISTAEALAHVFALVRPLDAETVPLRRASGRVLAAPVVATQNQPPFATATMDGYAVSADTITVSDHFEVIGEAAAGHGYEGTVGKGQAVRIFTGAPLPTGAIRVLVQEDGTRTKDAFSVNLSVGTRFNIREIGADFKVGDRLFSPRRLSAPDIGLIASMNHQSVCVTRKPVVALIATGDELVMPGETPRPNQIIASNAIALAAMVEAAGGIARVLPIARDQISSLNATFEMARGADLIVTIGGASVGDHDLVGRVAEMRGMKRSFYKVAMRPGKPLMAGMLDDSAVLGLPGNPVSSIVCARLFMLSMIDVMLGLPATAPARQNAVLATNLSQNGPREHYMRARLLSGQVTVADRQDSALMTVLADANVLVVRPPNDPARNIGDSVEVLDL